MSYTSSILAIGTFGFLLHQNYKFWKNNLKSQSKYIKIQKDHLKLQSEHIKLQTNYHSLQKLHVEIDTLHKEIRQAHPEFDEQYQTILEKHPEWHEAEPLRNKYLYILNNPYSTELSRVDEHNKS